MTHEIMSPLDYVDVRLPAEVSKELKDDGVVLHRLISRGVASDLVPVITAVGVGADLITIASTHDSLRAMASRLIEWLRREERQTIELKVPGKLHLIYTLSDDDAADDKLAVRVARDLIDELSGE